MITLTLPDGKQRQVPSGTTGGEVAASIGPKLAKDAFAVKLNGKVQDLALPLTDDGTFEIVTVKHPDSLELIRHDCAHVMAEAVQRLFPGTQVTIGPAIENGFYYDFAREAPFTPDDFAAIEAEMRAIVQADKAFVREVWDRAKAIQHFEKAGERYKVELIRDLPESEALSIYRQGEWLDLCRGPHLPSTGKIGTAFKLMKVAGAYWRGDHRNAMLQRIYGTAWRDQKELDAYLNMLAEAEKRDHRKLGREMELFHQQDEAAGSVFWHPRGWALWRNLENYIRERLVQSDYIEVRTPQLYDSSLFKASGHWDMYGDKMFKVAEENDRALGIKPMNCPAHVQIFKQGIKSYRQLPIRMAEFGACHRNEPSGSLHGLMRVRAFTQDDAHIFCSEQQIMEESLRYFKLQLQVYQDLGFPDVMVKLALRPEIRGGIEANWDRAEAALREALTRAGLPFEELPGEGAFYGPKVEFHLKDAIGRIWQCGTLQLDFIQPERLEASYVGEDGAKHRPVMLHRAILGSIERFIGVMIEHTAGHLPYWLAPLHAVVATITNEADAYAEKVAARCREAGLEVETDLRPEKINYKIREHSVKKVPVLLVVGQREAAEETVALRRLGGEKQEMHGLKDAVNQLAEAAQSPARQPLRF